MKKKGIHQLLALAATLSLAVTSMAACGSTEQPQVTDTLVGGDAAAVSGQGQTAAAPAQNLLDVSDMFTDRDLRGDYDEAESVAISLTGGSASCDFSSVVISGNTVTITAEGIYILSGRLEGMIIVDADDKDKVQLVLNGAEISNESGAAIYAREADKLFITLPADSQNSLYSGGYTSIDENNIDGVIFAKCDLTINGTGSLVIEAEEGHGVVTKDDLVVAGATVTVNARGHGLEGKDSVRIASGQLNLTAGKDGIHSENADNANKGFVYVADGQFAIVSDGDGISAGYCLQIDGGNFSIVAGGGNTNRTVARDGSGGTVSAKGVKAESAMMINGGIFVVDSQDDALHSGGDLTVNGGTLTLATGDDGIHSDETVTVAGGSVNITVGYEGIEGNNVVIAGGEIRMNVTDDGLNAAGGRDSSGFGGFRGGEERFGGSDCAVTISGGLLFIRAAGDGIDSNGDLFVTGGEIYVSGPETGADGAIDYERTGQITGGVLVAVGSSQMAMNFGDGSTQGSILVSVANCQAGDEVQLTDSRGNVLLSYTAESSFNSVVVSCPQLELGETYTVTAGGNATQVTLDSLIYGSGFGGPGGWGRPGGFDGQGGGRGQDEFGGSGGRGREDGQDRQPGGDFDGQMPEGGFDGWMPGEPDQMPEMPEGGLGDGPRRQM